MTGELFHQCATRTDEVKLMNSPEFSSIDPPKFYTFLLLIQWLSCYADANKSYTTFSEYFINIGWKPTAILRTHRRLLNVCETGRWFWTICLYTFCVFPIKNMFLQTKLRKQCDICFTSIAKAAFSRNVSINLCAI